MAKKRNCAHAINVRTCKHAPHKARTNYIKYSSVHARARNSKPDPASGHATNTQYAALCNMLCTHLAVDQSLLHPFVLVARLQRHGVHAPLTAIVAGAQPVLLDALQGGITPREEVSKCGNIQKTERIDKHRGQSKPRTTCLPLVVGRTFVDHTLGAQRRIGRVEDASVGELGDDHGDRRGEAHRCDERLHGCFFVWCDLIETEICG